MKANPYICGMLVIANILAGCGGQVQTPPVNVAVTTDSYCSIYAKIRWSAKDTPETVAQVMRENGKYDRACGPSRVASSTRQPKATP